MNPEMTPEMPPEMTEEQKIRKLKFLARRKAQYHRYMQTRPEFVEKTREIAKRKYEKKKMELAEQGERIKKKAGRPRTYLGVNDGGGGEVEVEGKIDA